jgi:hypothetical protein
VRYNGLKAGYFDFVILRAGFELHDALNEVVDFTLGSDG